MSGPRHKISETFKEKKSGDSRSIIESSRQSAQPFDALGPKSSLIKNTQNIHYYSNSKIKGSKSLIRDNSQLSNKNKQNGS